MASIVADGPPPLATFAYDVAGRRTSRTLENGIASTYAYDADGQLTSLTHGSVETITYTYDAMHRRTGENRSSTPARTFGYDLTGQLIAVNQSTGNATFAYDAVGNRTMVTGASGAGSYTANNLNQYTTAGGVGALTYDANGNLATGGGATYTHDGNSHLVAASGPGSATGSFGRDGRNRDVKRTIDGVTTYLIYDGWNLVAEYDAAGFLTTKYIHGPRVDEIFAKVTPASTTFPLPDALGSTIAVTDASGAVLERVYYCDAFGTPTFRSDTGAPLPDTSTGTRFLFTGREWFARLGLYDYRNRTYSPRLGRFLQTDPILFDAGDVNVYRYVSNSPTLQTDPYGLLAKIPGEVGKRFGKKPAREPWEPTPLGGPLFEPTEMRLQGEEEIFDSEGCCLYKICHYSGLRGGYQDEGGGMLEANTSSVSCDSSCPETNGWAGYAGGGTGPGREPEPLPWDLNRPGAPTLR